MFRNVRKIYTSPFPYPLVHCLYLPHPRLRDFNNGLIGDHHINTYCYNIHLEASKRLARLWADTTGELIGPLPGDQEREKSVNCITASPHHTNFRRPLSLNDRLQLPYFTRSGLLYTSLSHMGLPFTCHLLSYTYHRPDSDITGSTTPSRSKWRYLSLPLLLLEFLLSLSYIGRMVDVGDHIFLQGQKSSLSSGIFFQCPAHLNGKHLQDGDKNTVHGLSSRPVFI